MVYDGSKAVAVAGTRERLTTADAPCYTLTVQAVQPDGDANAGNVFIGGTTVSSTSGLQLTPGVFHTFPPQETNARNVRDVWIDAAQAGDGVKFIYETR